ncbi:MAG TPA: response regulator, partial [Chloroflexota bacterium]|nr:response regulator [Chloroflexota bacterium]
VSAPKYTGTLLVVDDNAVNRDVLSGRLERDGHTVLRAEHGQQALEILETASVDLVLLDIQMPVMNGYEVLARRRAELRLRDIPFLVISASDDMESVLSCIAMGAEDYLPKPFDPVLLQARIGACLERKLLRDEAERKARADLERAQAIQQRLLPRELAHWPGQLELAARFRPARETSGDFYDVFELAAAPNDDTTALPLQIAVADVAGKSVPAALVGALARTTLRGVAQHRLAVAAVPTLAVGAGAVGVLLDQNGLVIASTVNPDWQLRPVVPLSPAVAETLVKGTVWGRDHPVPPALDQNALTSAVGLRERAVFSWPLDGEEFHALAIPLRATPWSYVVALPVPTFDAAARDFRTTAIITAALALLLATGILLRSTSASSCGAWRSAASRSCSPATAARAWPRRGRKRPA